MVREARLVLSAAVVQEPLRRVAGVVARKNNLKRLGHLPSVQSHEQVEALCFQALCLWRLALSSLLQMQCSYLFCFTSFY